MKKNELGRKYVDLINGAWNYPTNGFSTKEFENYKQELIDEGIVEEDEIDDKIGILLLGFLVEKGTITEKSFIQLIKGQEVKTSVINYKDWFKCLIEVGVKINEKEFK